MQHLYDAARRYAEDRSATAVARFTAAKRAAIIRCAVEDAAYIDQRRLRILPAIGVASREVAQIYRQRRTGRASIRTSRSLRHRARRAKRLRSCRKQPTASVQQLRQH